MDLSDRLQARSFLLDEVYATKRRAEHRVKQLEAKVEELEAKVKELEAQPDQDQPSA